MRRPPWVPFEESRLATKRFDVGARVCEPTYGPGSVIAVEDAYTRIQFDDNTVRKFLTSLARLEPSSEPAPAAKPARARKRKTAPAAKPPNAGKAPPAEIEVDLDAVDAHPADAGLKDELGD